MVKIDGQYLGELRCNLTHAPSQSKLITDAPKDNRGKGEAYSPTDLLAAGLGSCMLTIIAIRARDKGIEIGNPCFAIEKEMQSNPRRISRLSLEIMMPKSISTHDRGYLEKEARSCPVALSLAKEIEQDVVFKYEL